MSTRDMTATAAAESRAADGRLFVISGDNAWVHVYPDAQTMLECKDTVAAGPGALEFFDVSGRRLAPVFSTTWSLEGLRETSDKAEPAVVRDRLCAVIESVRADIEQRLAEVSDPPGTLELALARLPELDGRSLAECFTLLQPNFGDGEAGGDQPLRKDDGSAWHNFWCH